MGSRRDLRSVTRNKTTAIPKYFFVEIRKTGVCGSRGRPFFTGLACSVRMSADENVFSVGEPSGNLHGPTLIREARRRSPHVERVGLGNPKMATANCRPHEDRTTRLVAAAEWLTSFQLCRCNREQMPQHDSLLLLLPLQSIQRRVRRPAFYNRINDQGGGDFLWHRLAFGNLACFLVSLIVSLNDGKFALATCSVASATISQSNKQFAYLWIRPRALPETSAPTFS